MQYQKLVSLEPLPPVNVGPKIMLQPIFRKSDAVVFATIVYQYIVLHKHYPVVSLDQYYQNFEIRVQVSDRKEDAEELANYLNPLCSHYSKIEVYWSKGAELWCVQVSVVYTL